MRLGVVKLYANLLGEIMKRRLPLLLVAVFALSVVLSGCNLFTMDKNAYYNQIVASITIPEDDDKQTTITVNKEELMQAYNRYYQTLSQNGYSGQALIDYLVDLLVDQKIVINEVTKLIESNQITLTNNDKNEIWTSTYENMEGLLKDYENGVLEDWDLPEAGSPSDETSAGQGFTPYQKTAEIVNVDGEWKIKLLEETNTEQKPLIYNEQDGVVKTVVEKLDEYVESSQVAIEAKKRYVADLKNYQSGRGFTTVNQKIWENEVERVYKSVLDNKYLTLYTDYLETASSTNGDKYSVVEVKDVFKYLESKVKSNYTKYTTNPSSFNTDILQSRSEVYYVMDDEDLGEYFYVSHILVKFEENLFTQLDSYLNSGVIDQATYDNMRENLIANTNVKSYGKEVEGYTIGQFYNVFKEAMDNAQTVQAKMDIFNEYMYEYNEDTGNKNRDYDYVIGAKNSQMVESFNEAARELYDNGNGEIGSISGVVESEHGLHILVYLGPVENWFDVEDINTFSLTSQTAEDLERNINYITQTKLSNLNTKTIFDYVFTKLSTSNVSILEVLNLNSLKHDVGITKYPNAVKDLY